MLYQIFQKAEANDLVRRNPVRLAEKMRASGTAKRKEAFTTEEVAHLMKVLPDDRMGLSIRLLLGTGMRMPTPKWLSIISMFRNPFGRLRSSCSARRFRPENWTEQH